MDRCGCGTPAATRCAAAGKDTRGRVYSVALSPDGQWAVSGGNDRTIRIWDVKKGKEVGQLVGHANAVIAVAFSPDGQRVLSGSSQYQTRDRILRIRDAGTERRMGGRDGGDDRVESIVFCGDGGQALLSDAVRGACLWSLR